MVIKRSSLLLGGAPICSKRPTQQHKPKRIQKDVNSIKFGSFIIEKKKKSKGKQMEPVTYKSRNAMQVML
jgi:hypothetical protein